MSDNCAVILAGGNGKRMKSDLPKPMFKVLGEPMIDWVIKACKASGISAVCVVTGYNHECLEEYLGDRCYTVFQEERKGTGHAVMTAREFIENHSGGNTLILNGDAPFIDKDTIISALNQHTEKSNAVTVITSNISNPFGYGRIIRSGNGISSIVEEKEATMEQKKITEINSGVYWFNTENLLSSLDELKNDNSQGEYYLTDTVAILLNKGLRADAYLSQNPEVVLGANDRKGLLELNNTARMNEIYKHLDNGVEFNCTDGITIERGVIIGSGTLILPGTIIKGKTIISDNCVIGPNCLIDDCIIGYNTKLNYVQAFESTIGDNVKIGPFVHVRPNSTIKSGVKIGDFVEVKNSVVGEDTAIAHLTYVGDSDVGRHVNFGCGCVTVNYDGCKKSRTTIGDNAFIGCNTNLIAPVTVGNGAYTAAGTTVTKDVPDNALALDRGEFRIKEGYALRKLKGRNT